MLILQNKINEEKKNIHVFIVVVVLTTEIVCRWFELSSLDMFVCKGTITQNRYLLFLSITMNESWNMRNIKRQVYNELLGITSDVATP